MSLNRRKFLQKAMTTSALLPLSVSSMYAAESTASKKRLLIVYTPDGCHPSDFHPTGSSETNFSLGAMTTPMEAMKKKSIFLEGLNMYSGGLTHEGGIKKIITGVGPDSLDYHLSKLSYFKETAFSRLNLGVSSGYQNGSGYMTFGSNRMLAPIDNPLTVYNSIFPNLNASAGGSTSVKTTIENPDRSILDRHLQDLNALKSSLGSNQKEKLELHLESIREVEKRIVDYVETNEIMTGGCSIDGSIKPELNTLTGSAGYPAVEQRTENFAKVTSLHMKLIAQAFSCDVTRVATLQWSHPVSPNNFSKINGVSQNTHDASHSQAGNQNFIKIKQWYLKQYNTMLKMLDERGILDDTIVLLCSELGDGSRHDHKNMPFIISGGANLGLKQGVHLKYRDEAHSKMLVSMANALGSNVNSFGYTGKGSGGLSGFTR